MTAKLTSMGHSLRVLRITRLLSKKGEAPKRLSLIRAKLPDARRLKRNDHAKRRVLKPKLKRLLRRKQKLKRNCEPCETSEGQSKSLLERTTRIPLLLWRKRVRMPVVLRRKPKSKPTRLEKAIRNIIYDDAIAQSLSYTALDSREMKKLVGKNWRLLRSWLVRFNDTAYGQNLRFYRNPPKKFFGVLCRNTNGFYQRPRSLAKHRRRLHQNDELTVANSIGDGESHNIPDFLTTMLEELLGGYD